MGRPKPASPLHPNRGPIIVVDEKYSWSKHVEYPASPASPFWKPPSAPPKPSKPKPGKPKPAKYAYYYPSSPLSRNLEDRDSSEFTSNAPSVWTPVGPKIRHCEDDARTCDDARACYDAPPRHFVDEIKPKAYWDKAGHQAYVEEGESEASRRMRVAREGGEQMRADEEMLKQRQGARREAEKAHWETQLDRERGMRRESERKLERAYWEMQMAREQTRTNKNTWEENECERVRVMKKDENVRGLGIQGLEHESWERVPVVRAKPEVKQEYGIRRQKPEDYEEWKLEIHNPAKGKNKDKGVMRSPQRWIEVREKPEGKVEVVMVRRRKPRY